MKQQHDSKGELRAAVTMRGLENAKRSCQVSTPATFIRVALGVVFMYLVVISHQMLGAIGPVFISVLFLVAFFAPYLYQTSRGLLERRGQCRDKGITGQASLEET